MKTFVPTQKIDPSTVPSDIKKVKDFRWPFYRIPKYNDVLINYLYSLKDENSKLFPRSNLMFVLGPEKIGKSWFLKYNLRQFDKTVTLVLLK